MRNAECGVRNEDKTNAECGNADKTNAECGMRSAELKGPVRSDMRATGFDAGAIQSALRTPHSAFSRQRG